MSQRDRVAWAVAGSILAAVTVRIAQPHSTAAGAVLLAAGVVLGELLVLRLADGTGLPLSYAVIVVIATCFPPLAVVALVAGAELVAAVVRDEPPARASRVAVGLWRVLVAGGALGAFRIARHQFGVRVHLGAVLGALVVTVAAAMLVDELLRFVTRRRSGLAGSGNVAWTALGSCAVLMSVGYSGVNGRGDLGIWGPLLFSIPLLATWYSFDRLDSINRTYRQTIEALAMAPELGGLVREGHAERVARLATAIGRELDLDDAHLQTLETAALLHHIGQVTLDEPPAGTRADPVEVAVVTAELMRGIEPLQSAAEIVALSSGSQASPSPTPQPPGRARIRWRREATRPFSRNRARHVPRGSAAPVAIASAALKVASAFDDLTEGDADRAGAALEALYSSPGYVYDLRALEALERLLDRGGRPARA